MCALNCMTLQLHNRFNWYVINTNPKAEDLVYNLLKKEEFELFLPKIAKKSNKNLLEPLFPGYLFIRLNIDAANWVKIKYLQGVRKILSFGSIPTIVPEELIEHIKQRISDVSCPHNKSDLKPGDKVEFLCGPFKGLEGIFIDKFSGKERVKILLEGIYRSAFTVELKSTEVAKVN